MRTQEFYKWYNLITVRWNHLQSKSSQFFDSFFLIGGVALFKFDILATHFMIFMGWMNFAGLDTEFNAIYRHDSLPTGGYIGLSYFVKITGLICTKIPSQSPDISCSSHCCNNERLQNSLIWIAYIYWKRQFPPITTNPVPSSTYGDQMWTP